MRWKKFGRIYSPHREHKQAISHASMPIPFEIQEGLVRVFHASRDISNRSHIWSIDIKLVGDNWQVIEDSLNLLLKPGPAGHFDDCGVYPSSIVILDDAIYLYYIGWVSGATKPMFYANVGLAISKDNGNTFYKYSRAPIFGRDEVDPWMTTSPFVLKENEIWKMWYVGGSHWDTTTEPWKSYYHIKYASSQNGITWKKANTICLPLKKGEHHISRTFVFKDKNTYRSLFGLNSGRGYELKSACSKDGITWKRDNNYFSGFEESLDIWEKKAQTYPHLIKINDRNFIFYNGNDFGKSGFGIMERIE